MLINNNYHHPMDLNNYLWNYWYIPSTVFTCSYLLFTLGYSLCDYMQPRWYIRKAIPTIDIQPIFTLSLWCWLLLVSCCNLLLSFVVGCGLWSLRWYFIEFNDDDHSTWKVGLFHLVVCYLWTDIWFWTSHYLMHRFVWLYKHGHKMHHRYAVPFAITTLYSHPIEMIFTNLPISIVMPCLLGMHWVYQSIWLVLLCAHITTIHSSHQLIPIWMTNVNYHLQHHTYHNKNYGAGWMEHTFKPNTTISPTKNNVI